MKVKSTNSIFFSKFSLIFKIILFVLILSLITSVIAFSIVAPISKDLRSDIDKVGIGYKFVDYIDASLHGENLDSARAALIDATTQIDDVMAAWSGEIAAAISILILFIIIFAILYFMAFYTITDIVNSFMSSNSDFGFAANYIKNLKKSFIFSVFYTLYVIVLYVVGFGLALAIGLLMSQLNAILGLFTMVLLAIGTLALRRALVPFWMPAMAAKDMSIKDAFIKNFELLKGTFWRMFGEYFVIYTVALVALIGAGVLTFGVAVLIVYAGAWLYMQIKDMVEYYHLNGMKYYIDEQKVVNPKKIYRDAVLDDENFSLN